jgi:hypothetical protein
MSETGGTRFGIVDLYIKSVTRWCYRITSINSDDGIPSSQNSAEDIGTRPLILLYYSRYMRGEHFILQWTQGASGGNELMLVYILSCRR